LPVSNFVIPGPVCLNTPLTFSNLSNVSSGSITSYTWDFGDGTTSNAIEPSHIFSGVGVFQVSLFTITDVGCTDSFALAIVVNPLPNVDFETSNQCVGIPVEFRDLSNGQSTQLANWNWEFGDGTAVSSIQNPEHVYSYPGWYDVTLTVTTDSGCITRGHRSQALFIYPLPEAAFTYTPQNISILDPLVQFLDQSSRAVDWWWEFGYGEGQSILQHPVYQFQDTGIYKISLFVTSSDGCRDSAYAELYVNPFYTFYIPNAFTPNGDGLNDAFIPSGIGVHEFDMIIFDRWGKSIFRTNNIDYHWNGDAPDGTACPEGVYVYKVRVKEFRNVTRGLDGHITLIR
jgi:gliding motility-associated-like protein